MNEIAAHLQPFVGYVELGMFEEAAKELDELPSQIQRHPMVLLARLELLVEMHQWEEGVLLGASLCSLHPRELEFWFKTAFCQHELKRTAEARETLLNAPPLIRKTALFYYNLACYETQLGNLSEGKRLLEKSCVIDKQFHRDALNDPDLLPLKNAGKSHGDTSR